MAFDIVFRNATVVDGTGNGRITASVGVSADIIEKISTTGDFDGHQVVDATGLVLAPGFIDAHAHDDNALFQTPFMPFKISQGVTTVINGNCGLSLAPLNSLENAPPPLNLIAKNGKQFFSSFESYFSSLDEAPSSVNSVCLVGHSTLRFSSMENLDQPATDREISLMNTDLVRSLEQGAIGLSTGLFYPPAKAAPTEEVIELCKSLVPYNGIYVTHMRDEADGVMKSIEETARIGREAAVEVVISHHKCAGKNNHGRSLETLAKIDEIGEYLNIGLDAYPYIASSTMLGAGNENRASKVLITWSDGMPEAANRELSELVQSLGLTAGETVERLMPAGGVFFTMDENDVQRILKHPKTVIGSDGISGYGHPHPRLWGTFPRVLGHYSRELGLFSLEDAIRKMTYTTAQRFGIQNRGIIREGAFADLVLFDPKTVIDTATFDSPMQEADGIHFTLVNGEITWTNGRHTGVRSGRVLRGRHV